MVKKVRAQYSALASVYKLLSDESRLRVIEILSRSREPLSVGDIAATINMSHSATSHLLGTLFRGEVVENLRVGREKLYTMTKNTRATQVRKLLKKG